MNLLISVFVFLSAFFLGAVSNYEVNCSNLLMGQYICELPDIDHKTQQPRNCEPNNKAKVSCNTSEGLICKPGSGTSSRTFVKEIDCQYTTGYSFETALLLSLFLGMFGADRFYLGYPAIGLAKLCTLGFMFLGHMVDIVLIALQVVGPSDGSHYVISYFGPKISILKMNNDTYIMRQDDW